MGLNMLTDRVMRQLTRIPGIRRLWRRFPFGSVALRVRYDIFSRPAYAYGVYSAAGLAKSLGLPAISVIEFGVAGGQGLLALESIAALVSESTGIQIRVAGFDSGQGLPPPTDYRDLPHVFAGGFYTIDEKKLRAALSSSTELIIGDVGKTVTSWLTGAAGRPPVGFISFDLDYYSSTKDAFRLFDAAPASLRLPRVYCYFDDIVWPEYACHNEHVGELCAIKEFNEQHARKKICPVHMLRCMRAQSASWNEEMYVFHDFEHPLYCRNITPPSDQQLP